MSSRSATRAPRRAKQGAAVALYLSCIFFCGYVIWSSHDEIASEERAAASTRERLEALQIRRQPASNMADNYGLQPGDPFLPGDKITVAAAELQRRVATEITRAGGGVVSSRIERSANPETSRDLKLGVEFEISQAGLQPLLYNIEASTPFLFVEKLSLRNRSETLETSAQPTLRVSLLVSGAWRDEKS